MTSFQDAPDEATKLTKKKRFVLARAAHKMKKTTGSKTEVTRETMERDCTTRGGGGGGRKNQTGEKEDEVGGTTGFGGTNPVKRKRATTTGGNSSSNSNKQKSPRSHPPPLLSPSPSMLLTQPRPCLVKCLSYLDSDSIREVCLLSKEFHTVIHNDPGMENTWTKLLEIRPSSSEDKTNDEGRINRLVKQLYHHRHELQMIQELRIIDPHKFKFSDRNEDSHIFICFQLSGIVSLHMVSSPNMVSLDTVSSATTLIPPKRTYIIDDIFTALKWIVPFRNLRVLDLANATLYSFTMQQPMLFLMTCSSLEQLTYTSTFVSKALEITGNELKRCTNLTELNLDDSTFRGYNEGLSDLENDQNCDQFLFYKCSSKVLRNVSIKNAMYDRNEGDLRRPQVLVPLPQKALIKFVRNGPASLRYFRSDLTPKNVEMLRLERPEIVFS